MAVNIGGAKKAHSEPASKFSGFLKTGKEAAVMAAEADAKAQAAMDSIGKPWRFRIGKKELNKEFVVTFLDGDLNDEGMIDAPMFYEHTVFHAGRWQNVVCLESAKVENCPLCEAGDKNSMVCVLSVIDQTEFVKKDGTKGNNQKRLFVAKRTSLKILQKLATKRGGLAGCTFEISRSGEKEPSIGNMFEFVEKLDSKELKSKFGTDKEGKTLAVPFDYEAVIEYKDRDALLAVGFGSASASSSHSEGGDTEDEL